MDRRHVRNDVAENAGVDVHVKSNVTENARVKMKDMLKMMSWRMPECGRKAH